MTSTVFSYECVTEQDRDTKVTKHSWRYTNDFLTVPDVYYSCFDLRQIINIINWYTVIHVWKTRAKQWEFKKELLLKKVKTFCRLGSTRWNQLHHRGERPRSLHYGPSNKTLKTYLRKLINLHIVWAPFVVVPTWGNVPVWKNVSAYQFVFNVIRTYPNKIKLKNMLQTYLLWQLPSTQHPQNK